MRTTLNLVVFLLLSLVISADGYSDRLIEKKGLHCRFHYVIVLATQATTTIVETNQEASCEV